MIDFSEPTTAKGIKLCCSLLAYATIIGLDLTNLDLAVDGPLLLVELIVVIGVHLEVVESELLLDALLKLLALLQGEGIGLGNNGNDVDNVGELLQHDNVDRLKRVTRGLDEEEAAVDTGILDVALSLSSKLLAEVGGVLVLDVLDDGVPAAVVVDQITVARGIDNVQPETNTIFLDDVRNGLNLGGGADGLLGGESALGLDEVRGEDGVDEGRLAQTSLAYDARDALAVPHYSRSALM